MKQAHGYWRVPVQMAILLGTVFWSGWVLAAQKLCPVCHEVYDSKVEICPNDGTDLKLLGSAVSKPPAEGTDEAPADAGSTDESKSDNEGTGESALSENGERKYTRQDRGGRRKRTAQEDELMAGDERMDRLRRLQDERAGIVAVRKREVDDDSWLVQDAELRRQYLLRRQSVLSKKTESETPVVVEDPRDAQRRAIWSKAAPLMSMGTRISWMGEAKKAGPIVGAEIDLNLLRTNIRVGLSSFIGIRHVLRKELLFLQSVAIGVQRPWRFSPYLVGRIGIGTIASERFGVDITELVRGIGFDSGVDCHLRNEFVVTPSFGYVRYSIKDAAWDSVAIKLSLGF